MYILSMMFRKYFILWILISIRVSLYAQDAQSEYYHILHIKGSIKLKSTGQELKSRDKINAEEEIIFGSKDDAVAVISNKKGRMLLSPVKSLSTGGELVYFVKENLLPVKVYTTTRGTGEFNNMPEIMEYFTNDPFLVLAINTFKLSPEFGMGENSYFSIRYNYKDVEIDKKLELDQYTLILDREALFTVDSKLIDPANTSDHALYYYDPNMGFSIKICLVTLVIPNLVQIKEELLFLKEVIKQSELPQLNLQAEIRGYLRDTYGNYDDSALKKLLEN